MLCAFWVGYLQVGEGSNVASVQHDKGGDGIGPSARSIKDNLAVDRGLKKRLDVVTCEKIVELRVSYVGSQVEGSIGGEERASQITLAIVQSLETRHGGVIGAVLQLQRFHSVVLR